MSNQQMFRLIKYKEGRKTMADIHDVAKCFLYLDDTNEGGDGITNMKLQKLVYYAQGFYGAIFNEPLFDNEVVAWTHGPVVPELYHQYKSHGRNSVPYHNNFLTDSITEQEFELIKEVYGVFGQFSAWKLRDMTHEEKPWLDHEKQAAVIPFPEIESYFKTQLIN